MRHNILRIILTAMMTFGCGYSRPRGTDYGECAGERQRADTGNEPAFPSLLDCFTSSAKVGANVHSGRIRQLPKATTINYREQTSIISSINGQFLSIIGTYLEQCSIATLEGR